MHELGFWRLVTSSPLPHGHTTVLQALGRSSSPQGVPPSTGAVVIERVLVCPPPPHLALHAVHAPQLEVTQWTSGAWHQNWLRLPGVL